MSTPSGTGFIMQDFVDADYADDSITRISRTGFLIYLNIAPVYWMSKKKRSVETSLFWSEFIAMKQCTEYIHGLCYKIWMMGIPCTEPTFIFGNNNSVLANTTAPDSTLEKKSQSIAYHFICNGVDRNEWRTAYVNTHLNPADILTKTLPLGDKRTSFVRMILHYIFGWFLFLRVHWNCHSHHEEGYNEIYYLCSHWVTAFGWNTQILLLP